MPDLIDAERIDIFGTSAEYIDSCHKAGLAPAKMHSLAGLKAVLSTGSPLLPQSFDCIGQDWEGDARIRSSKISEIAVRGTIHGRQIGNDTALAHPECLAAYRNLAALQQ